MTDTPREDKPRQQWRKKPVIIEAIRWTGGNMEEVLPFFGDLSKLPNTDGHVHPGIGHCPPEGTLSIPTLEGVMTARAGDWIIKGVKGEFYPCKPDVFEQTYEPASAPRSSCAEPDPLTLELADELFGCFLHRVPLGAERDHDFECACCEEPVSMPNWVTSTHAQGCAVAKARDYLAKHAPHRTPGYTPRPECATPVEFRCGPTPGQILQNTVHAAVNGVGNTGAINAAGPDQERPDEAQMGRPASGDSISTPAPAAPTEGPTPRDVLEDARAVVDMLYRADATPLKRCERDVLEDLRDALRATPRSSSTATFERVVVLIEDIKKGRYGQPLLAALHLCNDLADELVATQRSAIADSKE